MQPFPTTIIELKELCEMLSLAMIVPVSVDQYWKDKKRYIEAKRLLDEKLKEAN